jgi:hypothetical protein
VSGISHDSASFRLSLRSLLIAVGLAALGCTFLPPLLSENVHSVQFRIAAALTSVSGALAAYALGSICAHLARRILRFRVIRYSGWLLVVAISASTCYLLWAHQRWVDFPDYVDDPVYPRSFPYPDEILLQYHNWLDARNPPPPKYLKFHGEFYTVMEHLHYAIIAGIAAAFFVFGLIAPILGARLGNAVKALTRHVKRGC